MLVLALIVAACLSDSPEPRPSPNASGPANSRNVAAEPDDRRHRLIRSVNFANFTFPWVADLADPDNPSESFTLKEGEFTEGAAGQPSAGGIGLLLRSVVYGDVTGDGAEEALIVLSVVTGGSSVPHAIYVYTLEGERPRLLWSFSTGDRADGGLRQVRADGGILVVERYSPEGSRGDCCPTRFVRTHYVWSGNSFERKGEDEVLPAVEQNGAPVLPAYQRP